MLVWGARQKGRNGPAGDRPTAGIRSTHVRGTVLNGFQTSPVGHVIRDERFRNGRI